MEPWTRERVLALAGDASSAAAALAITASDWVDVGRAEHLLWGRCRGNGRTPYQSAVLLGDRLAFTCSCPSRKLPCKHVLALLLRCADGDVFQGAAPDYAADLGARAARRAENSSPAGTPGPDRRADAGAAAKRLESRAQRVAGGLDELDRWLHDQVRGGLAQLERAGYRHFDTVAARMVDAQAPGVAGMLRAIPATLGRPDWPERVLEDLAALHLLVRAHRGLAALPPDLAATVRTRVGYPVAKQDVLATPGVVDHWVALGMVDTVEYRLETRRVWLLGETTGRWAVLVSFAPPGGSLDTAVLSGHRLHARLHFYPGSGQLRALVGEQTSVVEQPRTPEPEDLASVRGRFARLLADDPWASRLPAVLAAAPVLPERQGERWQLRDESGACCEITDLADEPWPLLARSGGDPIPVFGEWSHRGFRPLSLLADAYGSPSSNDVGQAA